MNNRLNELGDFANQTKAILEKIELKKPIKKLKVFHPLVILLGFFILLISTVMYILGCSVTAYFVTGLVLCIVGGIFMPVFSYIKKERVCMMTYGISLAISTFLTWLVSMIINYYAYVLGAVINKKFSSAIFLNLGWPYALLFVFLLIVCVIVYFCLKKKIQEYSFEAVYKDVKVND